MRVDQVGYTTVYTPASGKRIRLNWLGLMAPGKNTKEVVCRALIGEKEIYEVSLDKSTPFSRSSTIEGAVDESLRIHLDENQTVYVNFDIDDWCC